jgi:exopolysaccharide biosynthesis predicted pyruvyltransferase EpsI
MTAEFRAEVERAIRGHPDSSQYFVFLQPDHEKSLIEECKTWLPAAEIIGARSLKDLQKSLTDAALVITARYHGAVIAAAMGRSLVIVPQGRGDKLDALDHFLRTDGVATLRRRAEEGVHCLNSTLRTMRR